LTRPSLLFQNAAVEHGRDEAKAASDAQIPARVQRFNKKATIKQNPTVDMVVALEYILPNGSAVN
jgi:hypothetical protein